MHDVDGSIYTSVVEMPSATDDGSTTQLMLLPSMQFAREFSTLPSGKKTYMTTAGKLVCAHGECSSTICHWLAEEKRAKLDGQPPPPRGGSRGGLSLCDCQTCAAPCPHPMPKPHPLRRC